MIERLLEPGSTDLPVCECGRHMPLGKTEVRSADTSLKIFQCSPCVREMRLMVWNEQD